MGLMNSYYIIIKVTKKRKEIESGIKTGDRLTGWCGNRISGADSLLMAAYLGEGQHFDTPDVRALWAVSGAGSPALYQSS